MDLLTARPIVCVVFFLRKRSASDVINPCLNEFDLVRIKDAF
jgi:hypothetical protein